jgi:uncharacterized membrane protein YqjE
MKRDDLIVVCGAVVAYALLILAAFTDSERLNEASTVVMICTILLSGIWLRP